MKRKLGLLFLMMLAVLAGALLSMPPAPEAAAPCLKCPLQPLPDECPPCTEFVPQTCRKCASCKPIKGCHA